MSEKHPSVTHEQLLQALELALERIHLAELALGGIGHEDERTLFIKNHLAGAFAEGFPVAVRARREQGLGTIGVMH